MRFEIFKTVNGQFAWRIVGANGEKMAHSETYVTKAGAQNAVNVVKKDAKDAPVKDLA